MRFFLADISLRVVGSVTKHTISFDANSGDGTMSSISIHDGNILLKGIQMFKESINLTNARVKNAFYELTSSPLNLYTKIRELNINYSSNIIVYFK